MKDRVKNLLPYIQEELANGRKKMDVFRELGFNKYEIQGANFLLREQPAEEDTLIVRPEREHKPVRVTIKGKTYYDVTAQIVDCGG